MRAIAFAALAGCSFNPQSATTSDAAVQGGGDAPSMADARVAGSGSGSGTGSGSGGGSGSGSGTPSLCGAPDMTGIVLCLELDDADLGSATSIAHDGAPGRHDANVTNSDVTMRTVPTSSQAELMLVDENSTPASILAGNGSDFDVQKLTIMLWAYPTSTPDSGTTYGLVEKDDQWLVGIDDDGDAFCEVEGSEGNVGTAVGDIIPINQWSVVACTYDGTNVCTLVLPGGSGDTAQSHCKPGPSEGTLATKGTVGPVIGSRYDGTAYSHLVGSIDSIRIFNRVLGQADICTGAGRSGC